MLFPQQIIKCSKCHERGAGIVFNNVADSPVICERCIVEMLTGVRPDHSEKMQKIIIEIESG